MMNTKQVFSRSLSILFLGALLCAQVLTACGNQLRNATVIDVLANQALAPWLQQASQAFNNDSQTKTAAGKRIYVRVQFAETGQAISDLSGGAALPTLWIPDSEVWANVLAERTKQMGPQDCVSLAQSPLVIGLWRPIAEALGWPSRSLGWLDIGSLAADPSAWNYYSGGQFGPTLRLGHTHPGLSGAGASTLLALVQAAQAKQAAVMVADIQQPIVQASVRSFESAVASFSQDGDTLGKTMRERGVSYLGAAVMYESTVIRYGKGELNIVPIYPFEGTFLATHPACLDQTASLEKQDAAKRFRDYLLSQPAQQLALVNGLRPVNPQVSRAALATNDAGVDLTQPKIVFPAPSVATLYAIQKVWQAARKPLNLVMLLDVSGSMRGEKIAFMQGAAVQFVQQMGDQDRLTLIAFATEPHLLFAQQLVGANRQTMIDQIQSLTAEGDTTLYDALGLGAQQIASTYSPQNNNALVVLTDGQDTRSHIYRFDEQLVAAVTANNTTVFTIAYGDDADEKLLNALAIRAKGNFYRGNTANVSAIYQEMATAFGGAAGIGR